MAALSGTYRGLGRDVELILRVDVDGPTALNMISGELNQAVELSEFNHFNLRRHSFIGDDVIAEHDGNRMVFSSPIRFFRLPELTGTIWVEIDPFSAVARLKLTGYGYHKQPSTFALEKTSDYFRDVRLEIDFEEGTEIPRAFNHWSVNNRPAGMPEEPVTIQGAFQQAGIDVIVHPVHSEIPHAAAGPDSRWSSAELHAAMTSFFSLIATEPTWNTYLLIGEAFEDPGVSGIMYDSDDALPRQGAAVFYRNFRNLPDGERQRNYLRTTVHELGHAMNLLHSFQKGVFSEFGFGDNPFMLPRPESLSYMNYPWRYPHGHNMPPGWNGTEDYWARFPFAFDRTELVHLRHHDRLEVIFGGESFGAHGHSLEAALRMPEMAKRIGEAPLTLDLRAKRVKAVEIKAYDHMEPIHLELKVACAGSQEVEINRQLDPSAGIVAFYIKKPNGEVAQYRPLMTTCSDQPETERLQPGMPVYQSLDLTFGRDGFYFAEPGVYEICAVHRGGERLTTCSNVLRIYVGVPRTSEQERLAADFFDPTKGQLLAVGPSASSQYTAQIDFFRDVAERLPDTRLGKYLAGYLGVVEGLPFKDVGHVRVRENGVATTRIRYRRTKAKPKEALSLIDQASAMAKQAQDNLSNLEVYRLGLSRARILESGGDIPAAKKAIKELKGFVAKAIPKNEPLRKREIAALEQVGDRIGTDYAAIAAE